MKKLEELKLYVPKHKQDNYYIEELNNLSDLELDLILDDLLIWIKNMQFEVSRELVVLLSSRGDLLTPKFINHLNDPLIEPVYKYNIINYIIKNFSKENIAKFDTSFKRILKNPTKEEKYSELDILIKNM